MTDNTGIQINKYDRFLFVLIASLAFGAIGGALQLPRMFSIAFSPFLVKNSHIFSISEIKKLFTVIICFLSYCIVSMTWTPNILEGLSDFVYLVLHLVFFMEIIIFSMCANRPIETITKAWLIAVMLTVFFAVWEIHTGYHLPYCINDTDALVNLGNGVFLHKDFAAVAFVNYNAYVTFLCFAIPFLFYIISNKKKESTWLHWLTIIIVLLANYCILKNGSRGGFLSVIVVFGVYFLMKPKNFRWVITILILLFFVYFVFIRYGDAFLYIQSRVSEGNLSEGGERFVVWKYALQRFFETFGFGVGVGGMSSAMQGVESDIKLTHNIFLEILLQYGFVFFFLFVVFLFKILFRIKTIRSFPTKVTLYTALITFPIYGIINSGYLLQPFVYAGLGSLYVISINYHDDFRYIYKNLR